MADQQVAKLRRLRWIPIILAGAIVVAEWAKFIPRARNDFVNHYEMGRRILHDIFIYEGDLNFVYPPFWAMAHAPFTIVSDHIAMLLLFPLGVAAVVGLVLILKKLTDRHWPQRGDSLFWGTVIAIFLAAPFIDRDLGEVGVNSFLVMLSWLGIYLWTQRRDVLGGVSIGLAAALKCTPIIFIGYFLWKRQWKIALVGIVATILFSLSPMLLMGPAEFKHAGLYWFEGVKRGVSDPDPSRGVLGEEKIANLSLRPALARYLMHLPYGHLGRPETSDDPSRPNLPEDPLYVQFLNLDPRSAGLVVRAVMLIGALIVAWSFRKPARDRSDISILWECATISLVILLYSPVTWRQHCVGVLPAIYFLIRTHADQLKPPRWVVALLIIFALFVCLPQRELMGTHVSKLFDAYRTKTFAILLLTVAMIIMRYKPSWSDLSAGALDSSKSGSDGGAATAG